LDERIGPNCLKQFVLGYEPPGMFQEVLKNGKGLRFYKDAFVGAWVCVMPETLIYRVESKWSEVLQRCV
jgi:hypothetical protein